MLPRNLDFESVIARSTDAIGVLRSIFVLGIVHHGLIREPTSPIGNLVLTIRNRTRSFVLHFRKSITMFGFLKPSLNDRQYRQVYAAYCAFQRREYGVCSTLFISYEAIFLYLMAIELHVCEPPDAATPTCCKLQSDSTNRWNLDHEVAQFCSAFAMLLAATKLEDDVRDQRSTRARILLRVLRKRFNRAKQVLDSYRPGTVDSVSACITSHLANETCHREISIDDYVKPTGEAFAIVFDGFSQLCLRRNIDVDLQHIGRAIGAAIVAADCVVDFERDHRRGEFTPLKTNQDRSAARWCALHAIASAGWKCQQQTCAADKTTWLLRSAFERVARAECVGGEHSLAVSKNATASLRKRVKHFGTSSHRGSRRGDCDCLGACACDACCDAPAVDGCGDGCLACPCEACCDPCCRPGDRERPPKRQTIERQEILRKQEAVRSLLGKTGVAVSILNPSGVVEIDGRQHPATSKSTFIAQGANVEVVESNTFGVTVVEVPVSLK